MRPALLIAFALLAATPAMAQDRTEGQRASLVALSRILGESDALHRTCEGGWDDRWATRMDRLVDAEQPDDELAARMRAGFKAGFAEGRQRHAACDEAARLALGQAAARGRDLAAGLANVRHRIGVLPADPQVEPAPDQTAIP